jgi:HD superfamily phosphohydrolase
LNQEDIEHGLIAAILHDIGQTAFGHDFEVVNSKAFSHERLISTLLDDKSFGGNTLDAVITQHWDKIDTSRVLAILGVKSAAGPKSKEDEDQELLPVDGLARDMINGPIDADKLDYLIRDSAFCGVPYGAGIDRSRFLRSLTLSVKRVSSSKSSRLAIAYRAKGAAAIESLLLARYQMYGAVYWHHTYRCIQAMLVQAASETFHFNEGSPELKAAQTIFYERVVCRRSIDFQKMLGGIFKDKRSYKAPAEVAAEPSLEFAWQFSSERSRRLLERVAARDLYKRVYEIRTGELRQRLDYSSLQDKLAPNKRGAIAEALEHAFLKSIQKTIQRHGPKESISESQAREMAQKLTASEIPLVVIDYPVRGIPDEKNIPPEIGDPARKYISGSFGGDKHGREVFTEVRRLQIDSASVRVFAEPKLHQLIVRYLDPEDVQSCVFEAMPSLQINN